jgi:hypothetical protein
MTLKEEFQTRNFSIYGQWYASASPSEHLFHVPTNNAGSSTNVS